MAKRATRESHPEPHNMPVRIIAGTASDAELLRDIRDLLCEIRCLVADLTPQWRRWR